MICLPAHLVHGLDCTHLFQLEDDEDGKIKFKSSFLGSVSADIFIPPNTIDFDDIFSNFGDRLGESWVVLLVMGLLLLGYIVALVIACRKDRIESNMVSKFFKDL